MRGLYEARSFNLRIFDVWPILDAHALTEYHSCILVFVIFSYRNVNHYDFFMCELFLLASQSESNLKILFLEGAAKSWKNQF